MKRILMATDLTARCDRALQRAAALANQFDAALRITHVVEESFFEFVTDQHMAAARTAIEQQIKALPNADTLDIDIKILRGVDYQDIIREAENYQADLVVLGIHRHETPELFRGTTAERVVRYGRLPVLVVKDPVTTSYRSTVAAVDLSTHARAAAELAARLTPGGVVHLLHVAHASFAGFLGRDDQREIIRQQHDRIAGVLESDINRLSRELGNAAPRFETVLTDGETRTTVRKQIVELKPDLLVIGTHGRTGIGHAILGSLAEDMLARAPVDVLAVRNLADT